MMPQDIEERFTRLETEIAELRSKVVQMQEAQRSMIAKTEAVLEALTAEARRFAGDAKPD